MMNRRRFVQMSGAALGALAAPASGLVLAGCRDGERGSSPAMDGGDVTELPARELRLVAEPGEVDLGPLGPYRTWMYNGRFPGEEIRIAEGERLRVVVENRLPDPTTVHWHGVPVPNVMDGVPGVTQEAVEPGADFVYEYVAEPAGSYMYHSHSALQLDRGLLGPLIIEERSPHVDYDREYTIVLDDLLVGEPRLVEGGRSMMMGMGSAGPEYDAFLINGRPPGDPAVLDIRQGERVRLRLINPASQTTFRVALAGHRMKVIHADGRPVEPVEMDAVLMGMGERYDVLIEADNPGAWNLVASSVERQSGSARAVFRYGDAATSAPPEGQMPSGISGGRLLTLEDLTGTEPEARDGREPDRTFDFTLSSRMMSDGWFIDGQAFPEAEPLMIHEGERVRVRMTNRSMMVHPMHLHGHFFRVGNALKETVIVPPHMGRVTFDFTADNPGDWFFHCHNLYHMEVGMARVFRYGGMNAS